MSRTIAAIATPPGTGGIGVVRLSGGKAIDIAKQIFHPYGQRPIDTLKGYTGLLGRIKDGEEDIDEAILFMYRGPRSYTGEDVVELSCHGGMWILRRVLRLCLDFGAQMAGPGEFTRRAFLNGKMDLSQAEAVMDLIGAQGDASLKAAMNARDGNLSTNINVLVEKLLGLTAQLAAWTDYPEDETEEPDRAVFLVALEEIEADMERLLETYDRGRLIRDGVDTVIAGKPNVGKSTLMNLMAGMRRSIVSDIPGTTRDVVEDSISLGDFVLRLSDTAGIRSTADAVEKIGVELAIDRISSAQLVLAVFDSSVALDREDMQLLDLLAGKPCVGVVNKGDLNMLLDLSKLEERLDKIVTISAQTGDGYGSLVEAVEDILQAGDFDPSAPVLANERQRDCLLQAAAALSSARETVAAQMTWDAVNVELDAVLDPLLSLTGQRVSDRVVDEVFSRFCVGK